MAVEITTDGANPRTPDEEPDSLGFLDAPDLVYEDGEPLFTEDELKEIGTPAALRSAAKRDAQKTRK